MKKFIVNRILNHKFTHMSEIMDFRYVIEKLQPGFTLGEPIDYKMSKKEFDGITRPSFLEKKEKNGYYTIWVNDNKLEDYLKKYDGFYDIMEVMDFLAVANGEQLCKYGNNVFMTLDRIFSKEKDMYFKNGVTSGGIECFKQRTYMFNKFHKNMLPLFKNAENYVKQQRAKASENEKTM